ncbi:MAG: carboxypeptidase regulatory-like domain-containing protein, partial [Saprospiraceae bacterium]
MHRIHLVFISLFFCATIHSAHGQKTILNGILKDKQTGDPIYPAKVQVTTDHYTTTTPEGRFDVEFLPVDKQELIFIAPGYDTLCVTLSIPLGTTAQLDFFLFGKDLVLNEVQVSGQRDGTFELQRLRNVENMAIYASKKSERIQLESVVANLATNNARQIYKDIPGLNIWENDGAGLQLSIGARGLDPNRTSNFNTRQNGYDISADALGYPESYYTPPSQALQRIEIVRGAAS